MVGASGRSGRLAQHAERSELEGPGLWARVCVSSLPDEFVPWR